MVITKLGLRVRMKSDKVKGKSRQVRRKDEKEEVIWKRKRKWKRKVCRQQTKKESPRRAYRAFPSKVLSVLTNK